MSNNNAGFDVQMVGSLQFDEILSITTTLPPFPYAIDNVLLLRKDVSALTSIDIEWPLFSNHENGANACI